MGFLNLNHVDDGKDLEEVFIEKKSFFDLVFNPFY